MRENKCHVKFYSSSSWKFLLHRAGKISDPRRDLFLLFSTKNSRVNLKEQVTSLSNTFSTQILIFITSSWFACFKKLLCLCRFRVPFIFWYSFYTILWFMLFEVSIIWLPFVCSPMNVKNRTLKINDESLENYPIHFSNANRTQVSTYIYVNKY